MAAEGRTALKTYFNTGDTPTEAQFVNLIDSGLNTTDDTLDNITAGSTNVHFTTTDESKLDAIEASADVTDATNVGTAMTGATAKTTPVDADTMPLNDSAASNVLKKVTWANVKATLKAYTDTLYAALGHTHTESEITDLDHDAVKLQGVGIDATVGTPSDGDILVYRSAGTDWVLEAKPAGGSSPAMADITDVTITTIASGEILKWNGSAWVNNTLAEAGIADTTAASTTTAGIVELATGAETNTGTDATRAVTPDALDDWTGSAQITTVGTLSSGNVDAAVSASSTTTAGKVEIATITETNTGTDATRAVSPDALAGSNLGIRYVSVTLNGSTALTTSDLAYFRIPAGLTGMNLVSVAATVGTGAAGSSSSGTPTFTVKNVTDANQMLSTNLTVDANEYTSATAATAAVINTATDDVVTDDLIEVACTVAGTGVTYATVTLGFQLP